ncbi:aminoacyl-tRNA deacylase [Formicincola oecophyllae]|uniref:Cys-tRNA(Pro)/Cys-tRNA(Cys) deacylase n=1 Tax=Formicincola oecophyllae TaxID=2558361 RepID=A0A4Y6U7C6_9PROT|nr:aminoacyl-tRNA deacylase [Formicincola oecophyllae]QDH13289.1 aminoacyl-tRNA deacylase [Formicincola oecophyllae]
MTATPTAPQAPTAATRFLEASGIPHEVRSYAYAPEKGHIGEQAATAIGEPREAVFKTLAGKIDRKRPFFALIPVDDRADFKAIAAAMGGKNAKMMQPGEAHERTGYVQGGTTPLGSQEPFPVVLDESALKQPRIWINAGAQGLLVAVSPEDLKGLLDLTIAPITQPAG